MNLLPEGQLLHNWAGGGGVIAGGGAPQVWTSVICSTRCVCVPPYPASHDVYLLQVWTTFYHSSTISTLVDRDVPLLRNPCCCHVVHHLWVSALVVLQPRDHVVRLMMTAGPIRTECSPALGWQSVPTPSCILYSNILHLKYLSTHLSYL